MSTLLQEHAPYVRAFTDPVYLANSEVRVVLYPQVKLYDNGVVLLQLRLFSPEEGTNVESLVEDFVNLPWMTIDRIDGPPTLLSLFGNASIRSAYPRWWQKRKASRLGIEHAAAHNGRRETRNFGDFDFEMVDVPIDIYVTEARKFEFVRELFLVSLAFLLAGGEGPREIGNLWGSRPSVFLTRFEGQPDSFPELDPSLRRSLVPIVMRSPEIEASVADRFPFENLRLFDDYLWILGEAVTLCVFSKKAQRFDEEFSDPNQGHLIYEKVVLGEAMEFLRYSHYRVLEVASSPKPSPEEALTDWQTIADIETVIRSPSNFGEISEAFEYYEGLFRLSDMRARALQALEMQRLRASERRGHRLTILGIVIAVVFGLGSVPAVRESFVVPFLGLLGFKTDSGWAGEILWQSILTLWVMFLFALPVWVFLRPKRMKESEGGC